MKSLFLFVYNGILQAILKIIKHCKEFSPALVTGQLLGLDVGSVLEVTNCFPFPVCSSISVYSKFDLLVSHCSKLKIACNFFSDQRRR